MVEIVSRGQLPGERNHTVQCVHCRSVLRFQEKEAKFCSDQFDTIMQITCPVCHKEVYHYPHKVRSFSQWEHR